MFPLTTLPVLQVIAHCIFTPGQLMLTPPLRISIFTRETGNRGKSGARVTEKYSKVKTY
jgi:hypothetical protein